MCPKPKHLKHFILEVLVGDLGVEEFVVESKKNRQDSPRLPSFVKIHQDSPKTHQDSSRNAQE